MDGLSALHGQTDIVDHLAGGAHLHIQKCLHVVGLGELAQGLLREGPQGNGTEQAHLQPLGAQRLKGTSYTKIKDWDSETRNYTHADPFPSVNVTYRINDKHLLRAAYGMSTNRPEFREVSPSVYYDFDLFSDVKGNADLKAAYIQNADLRWEWYPAAGEGISVAVFYKHFRNPIETAILDAGKKRSFIGISR